MAKSKTKWEYGDFQTPIDLASIVCRKLDSIGLSPKTVIEPSCGYGNFVMAAASEFSTVRKIYAYDINPDYIAQLNERIESSHFSNVVAQTSDFFSTDWASILDNVQWPLLVIGNPPWVTSAELSLLNSRNVPKKGNIHGYNGLDAITGKSNFDISEWMILRHIEWLTDRSGAIAMLCKTSVARKILRSVWQRGENLYNARMFLIDAKQHFGAAVDACLFLCESAQQQAKRDCRVYSSLDMNASETRIGYRNCYLVSNTKVYDKHSQLATGDENYVWRSGIKHDCSAVMELRKVEGKYLNGFNEEVIIEDDYVFPLLKSSDVGNGTNKSTHNKYIILTQSRVGEDTSSIQYSAPQTWQYLQNHKNLLEKRASRIYQNRAAFSIFGIGAYSFALWKVAISGLHKKVKFVVVGPREGKPTMLDDTTYFLFCGSQTEAELVAKWLNSPIARDFIESMVFWMDKRPITIDLLKRLNIREMAALLGEVEQYDGFFNKQWTQSSLFA